MEEVPVPVIFDITIIFRWIYNALIFVSNFSLSEFNFTLLNILWFFLGLVGFSLTVFFFLLYMRLEKKQTVDLKNHPEIVFEDEVKVNRRWFDIVQKIDSENPSDWNVAIIEADKILEEMTKKMGYAGDNLGERLKNVERSDFLTLDQAWQAHKIRNSIAHESDFVLTKREAQKTLRLFEEVFKEFGYI